MDTKWGLWEWIAYGCIWVAAIMLAINTGFRESPAMTPPHFLDTRLWGFTPLALLIISGVIMVIKARGWIRPRPTVRLEKAATPAEFEMRGGGRNTFERIHIEGGMRIEDSQSNKFKDARVKKLPNEK